MIYSYSDNLRIHACELNVIYNDTLYSDWRTEGMKLYEGNILGGAPTKPTPIKEDVHIVPSGYTLYCPFNPSGGVNYIENCRIIYSNN